MNRAALARQVIAHVQRRLGVGTRVRYRGVAAIFALGVIVSIRRVPASWKYAKGIGYIVKWDDSPRPYDSPYSASDLVWAG